MIKTIVQWIIYSSANPQNISLTLKGLAPLLVFFGLDEITSTSLIGDLGDTILVLGEVITLGITLYGLARKVAITIYKIFKK